MWKYISDNFAKYPSQMKVLKKLISIGLSVKKDHENVPRVYCGDVEVKASAIAEATNVDRRAVLEVLRKIIEDSELSKFYFQLKPVPDFGLVSSRLGMGVIQILPTSAKQPGIVSGVSQIIARENISIRQVIVDDPELVDDPKATIVTDSPIPARLLGDLKKIPGVEAVVLL